MDIDFNHKVYKCHINEAINDALAEVVMYEKAQPGYTMNGVKHKKMISYLNGLRYGRYCFYHAFPELVEPDTEFDY